jgi:hypothetical protein
MDPAEKVRAMNELVKAVYEIHNAKVARNLRRRGFSIAPPRIAICGPGRSGKDVAANTIARVLGVPYTQSTSQAAIDIVWDQWGKDHEWFAGADNDGHEAKVWHLKWRTKDAMFADRSAHRETWANIIWKYNEPDGVRLYREMLERGETILCGIRRPEELRACQVAGLVDLTIWIDRPNCQDTTCEIWADDCDLIVPNWGTEDQFVAKLTRLANVL